jgi:hypothetical protein
MADLTWTTGWESVLCYDDTLLPNQYTLTVDFNITTDNGDEQNIAFDRIKYLVDSVLQDAIFCSIDDEKTGYFQSNFKQKIVTFPVPPQDLAVASVLFAKIRSIVDGRLDIEAVKIQSSQGDNVSINFTEEFAEDGTMLDSHELIKAAGKTPWWYRDDCGTADFVSFNEASKELTFVVDVTGWEDTGLTWPSENEKKAKKDASNWNPTIIPGGKTHH